MTGPYVHDPESPAPDPSTRFRRITFRVRVDSNEAFNRWFVKRIHEAGGWSRAMGDGTRSVELPPTGWALIDEILSASTPAKNPPSGCRYSNRLINPGSEGTTLFFGESDMPHHHLGWFSVNAQSFAEACRAFVAHYERRVANGVFSPVQQFDEEASARTEWIAERATLRQAIRDAFPQAVKTSTQKQDTMVVLLSNGMALSVRLVPGGYAVGGLGFPMSTIVRGHARVTPAICDLDQIRHVVAALGGVPTAMTTRMAEQRGDG